jgi:general secretion pathway protein H
MARRDSQSGITLVEVLVVLVLIGVLTSAVALRIGSLDRGDNIAREAELLTARLNRAADEILITGSAMAFAWEPSTYHFLLDDGMGKRVHPVKILGEPHQLPSGITLTADAQSTGEYVVSSDLLPLSEGALHIQLSGGDVVELIRFDGASARRETPPS